MPNLIRKCQKNLYIVRIRHLYIVRVRHLYNVRVRHSVAAEAPWLPGRLTLVAPLGRMVATVKAASQTEQGPGALGEILGQETGSGELTGGSGDNAGFHSTLCN